MTAPDVQGRISQLLPTVKCSNCSQPVPLNQLSDHVCALVPSLPKPALSPDAAAALLPQRLQARLPPLRAPPNDAPPQHAHQLRSSPLARPADRSNAPSPVPFPRLPSPISARPYDLLDPQRKVGSSSAPSPLRPHHLAPDPRQRAHSNISRDPSSPRVPARAATTPALVVGPPRVSSTPNAPSNPFGPRSRPPGPHFDPRTPLPTDQLPSLAVPEIDTKSGGEAGMAGVGRRGFAAAARAAMLASTIKPSVAPPSQPSPGRPHNHNAPTHLNLNLPPRSLGTPPLSAGSGYTSSPSLSPFPQSPTGPPRLPSPDRSFGSKPSSIPAPLTSPSLIMDTKPSIACKTTPVQKTNAQDDQFNTPSTAKQLPRGSPIRTSESQYSDSVYSMALFTRSGSVTSSSSRDKPGMARRPFTPASEIDSDLDGLAYADSTTDAEDDTTDTPSSSKGNVTSASLPPPSILRSDSAARTAPLRFRSASDRSRRAAIHMSSPRAGHKRNLSFSSASSGSSGSVNSAVIAQALGLSQRPPSEYGRLGGPGIGRGGGRLGRSASGSSSGRSAYSRGASEMTGVGLERMEIDMETLLEDVAAGPSQVEELRGSTRRQRSFDTDGNGSASGGATEATGKLVGALGAHRSNTISGEPRSPKLAARIRTSTAKSADAKEIKERVCLKCQRKIEDGRWINVDNGNGGVLCEDCWKNMYLPKCRRCNLPIEKQAVSSSDGQLKGKYHRECFGCHVCHKPFPDKSFYVFDGRPLCAYHYHEVNNSLCAAARCGQPIEGPCAVSHAGDRYHPEHLTCEHPGDPPCKARLEEYWDVDGRMLCEHHAHASSLVPGDDGADDDGDGDEGQRVGNSKAMKRVTRFIDLS